MTILNSNVIIGRESIECGLWAIQRYLMGKYGVTISEIETAPLNHYVYSGRASAYFLRHLLSAKPYMIARQLHEGGSDDEVIRRIKNYLANHTGYNEW